MIGGREWRAALVAALAALLFPIPVPASSASHDDPLSELQWGLRRIRAPQAWRHTTGEGVVVGIVDSNIDFWHPDLRGKIRAVMQEPVVCFDPTPATCELPEPHSPHGTKVSGVVSAWRANGIGLAGVAPGTEVVFAHFNPSPARAIRWAVRQGADVLNFSWGVYDVEVDAFDEIFVESLERAIAFAWKKGAVMVAGAGNDYAPMCRYPSYDERVLCVGGIGPTDLKATYSNFGVRLDVVAPAGQGSGGCAQPGKMGLIITTTARWERPYDCKAYGPYATMAGTSAAAPHVTGVAALLASKGLTNRQIVECIKSTAEDLGPEGYDAVYGHGVVDALAAVRDC